MAVQVKKVRRPEANPAVQLYILEIGRGLWITARHFFRNFGIHLAHRFGMFRHRRAGVVVQWPEERRRAAYRLRGRHRLTRRADGTPRCVACYMCETACPAECIHIIAEEVPNPLIEKGPAEFFIDYSRCIFCGFCVEACPEDAIRMDVEDLRIAAYDRDQMTVNLDELLNAAPTLTAEDSVRTGDP